MSVFYLEAAKRFAVHKRPNFTPLWVLLVIITASFVLMNQQEEDNHDTSAQQHVKTLELSSDTEKVNQSFVKTNE